MIPRGPHPRTEAEVATHARPTRPRSAHCGRECETLPLRTFIALHRGSFLGPVAASHLLVSRRGSRSSGTSSGGVRADPNTARQVGGRSWWRSEQGDGRVWESRVPNRRPARPDRRCVSLVLGPHHAVPGGLRQGDIHLPERASSRDLAAQARHACPLVAACHSPPTEADRSTVRGLRGSRR